MRPRGLTARLVHISTCADDAEVHHLPISVVLERSASLRGAGYLQGQAGKNRYRRVLITVHFLSKSQQVLTVWSSSLEEGLRTV